MLQSTPLGRLKLGMTAERQCPKCGQIIPWGQVECPLCTERTSYFWSLRRDTFLLLTLLVLLLLFVATGFATKFYHAQEKVIAEQWFARGEAELRAGQASAAVEDFRNALAYSRDNAKYRLELDKALLAAGRLQEAHARLLALWEQEPGNGVLNLELARLAVRQSSVPEALRYYHNAIYGEWEKDPVEQRHAARLELAQFLLRSGQKAAAQSELIGLAADLPPDSGLETQVGSLLLASGENDQALKLFLEALRLNPGQEAALFSAGEAYYNLGNYSAAAHYLRRALEGDPHSTRAQTLAGTARLILSVNPSEPRLSRQERAKRTFRAFQQAMARLLNCAASRGINLQAGQESRRLQSLYAQAMDVQPDVQIPALGEDSDLRATVMDLAFDIENATAQECGQPQGLDLALLLLGRAQGGGRP